MKETLQIIDVGANGDGVAKTQSGETVFVPLAMTADVVEATIDKDKEGVLRAKIAGIVEKSPHRVDAPCQHFGVCGGCSLQHMGDAFYQTFKRHHVLESLLKAGISTPDHIRQIHVPAHTRRRANFATLTTKDKTIIGFHERKSSSIVDVPNCLLVSEDVRRVMEGLRPCLPVIAGQGAKMDVLIQCADGVCEIGLTGKVAPGWEAQQALSDTLRTLGLARISLRARDYESYKILLSEKAFIKAFDSLLVELAPCAFLQPSFEGERALVNCVMEGAGDASCIADLFCGNGTFTGALMGGREVAAFDSAEDSIHALQKAGVAAHARNLFKNPLSADELSRFDCVVLDPPRAGAREQVEQLAASTVPKIVYVSCNPQTFARDAGVLQDAGYALSSLTIVDQFIWSAHTEVVGVWTR